MAKLETGVIATAISGSVGDTTYRQTRFGTVAQRRAGPAVNDVGDRVLWQTAFKRGGESWSAMPVQLRRALSRLALGRRKPATSDWMGRWIDYTFHSGGFDDLDVDDPFLNFDLVRYEYTANMGTLEIEFPTSMPRNGIGGFISLARKDEPFLTWDFGEIVDHGALLAVGAGLAGDYKMVVIFFRPVGEDFDNTVSVLGRVRVFDLSV